MQWRRYLFTPKETTTKYDLVVSSYVLSELPSEHDWKAAVKNLWVSTAVGGVLVNTGIILFTT